MNKHWKSNTSKIYLYVKNSLCKTFDIKCHTISKILFIVTKYWIVTKAVAFVQVLILLNIGGTVHVTKAKTMGRNIINVHGYIHSAEIVSLTEPAKVENEEVM